MGDERDEQDERYESDEHMSFWRYRQTVWSLKGQPRGIAFEHL